MENICNLCQQVVVLQRVPVMTVCMIQIIPQIFPGVNPFILYFPPFSFCTCDCISTFLCYFQICNSLEPYGHDFPFPNLFFFVFQYIYFLVFISNPIYKLYFLLFSLFLFRNLFVLFHDIGNTSRFITDDIIPMSLFANVKHRLPCIQAVAQQENRQTGKVLPDPFCKLLKRFVFTVLFDLLCIHLLLPSGIFPEFCIKAYDQVIRQYQFCFQCHTVPQLSFPPIFLHMLPAHAEFVRFLPICLQPCPIYNHQPFFRNLAFSNVLIRIRRFMISFRTFCSSIGSSLFRNSFRVT